MDRHYKRINITIGDDQYAALSERGVNVSGLIRDLVGDYLTGSKITLQVSEETRRLYELVIANTGATDADLEAPLRAAFADLLEQRIAEMQALYKKIKDAP